jgi:hypothetical protein
MREMHLNYVIVHLVSRKCSSLAIVLKKEYTCKLFFPVTNDSSVFSAEVQCVIGGADRPQLKSGGNPGVMGPAGAQIFGLSNYDDMFQREFHPLIGEEAGREGLVQVGYYPPWS